MKIDLSVKIKLDQEHIAQTLGLLHRCSPSFSLRDAEVLCGSVSSSIDAYIVAKEAHIPFRKTHKELRDLWQLCNRSAPVAKRIKEKAHSLSEHALTVLAHKASFLFPKLLKIEFTTSTFHDWLNKAKKADLIWVLRVCIAERVFVADGRERGDRPQSRAHLEPRIMGYTRRGEKKRGNSVETSSVRPDTVTELRPDPMNIQTPPVGYQGNIGVDSLIMFLAVDWAIATGEHPLASQGSQEIFIAFIDMVFNWLEKPNPKKMLAAYIKTLKAPETRLELAITEKN